MSLADAGIELSHSSEKASTLTSDSATHEYDKMDRTEQDRIKNRIKIKLTLSYSSSKGSFPMVNMTYCSNVNMWFISGKSLFGSLSSITSYYYSCINTIMITTNCTLTNKQINKQTNK